MLKPDHQLCLVYKEKNCEAHMHNKQQGRNMVKDKISIDIKMQHTQCWEGQPRGVPAVNMTPED